MKTRTVKLEDRKISFEILSKKDVGEIFRTKHLVRSQDLSEKAETDAYVLDQCKLMLVHNAGGALYNSIKDFEDLISFLNKDILPHPLYNGISYDKNFISRIDSIISENAMALGIDINLLDYSLESLGLIEGKLKINDLDEFEIERRYLIFLMTYSGEIIRRKVGGSWLLKEIIAEGKVVLEPVIQVDDYKVYSSLWPIVEELNENPQNFSLSSVIIAEIEKYKLWDEINNKNR